MEFGFGWCERTYEESIEGQTDDVGSECQHHEVDLKVLESHHKTVGRALTLVGISLTDILKDTQLSNETLLLGETTGVGGEIGQDESSRDSNGHGNGTFDPEEPSPSRVAQNTLHVGQHTGGNKRGEGIGDQVTTEQDGVPGGQLLAGVPLGQDKKSTRQESSLDETQQETNGHHVAELLCVSGQSGNKTPEGHGAGNVERGSLNAVDEHVGGHLHQNVSNVEDAQTGGVLGIGEVQV